jgi:hypothetical protein
MPEGIQVRVTHMPSGKTRVVNLVDGESVGQVRLRLRKEIENEFCSTDDFQTQIYQENGRKFIKVSHKPSEISRLTDQWVLVCC